MKRVYRFTLTLALGLGLVVIALAILGAGPTQTASGKTSSVVAQPPTLGVWGPSQSDNINNMASAMTYRRAQDSLPVVCTSHSIINTSMASTTSMLSLFDIGALSVSDSTVTTDNCYEANKTQTLCFTVYNGSTDSEWLTMTRATLPVLPSLWQVSCKSQDATDSSGNPVHFTCSTPSTNEVVYVDNDIESPSIGEVSAGSSWGFCIDVNVPGANGPRIVNWGVYGDREPGSAEPHDVEGQTTIEECTPLMLEPSSMVVEGCNGVTQTLTFELWNHSAGNGTFNLMYNVPSGNATFTGPSSFSMSNGEIVTFTVQLAPDLCLSADTKLSATIEAEGNSQYDSSTITHTITSLSGWQVQTSSITPTMDNAVVWASYADGGLWSIGGYGATGATQRYDPNTGTWSTHTPETVITPTIEYPMDGCYGLNDQGHEIVVLFPDTIVTGSLHIYNITQDNWYTETIPAFYPEEGRWGQDIVSLLSIPGVNQNVCYLSGGSPQEGGGRTRNLWVYYPETNSGGHLEVFPASIWFNFHASWYVPWVGNSGAICVGGGIDRKSNIASATQCYDLETGTFRGVNADLGPLPEPWWGMADGWQTYHGRYQIWIANGVAQDGTLLPASAYADETTGGFVSGPELLVGLYRLEGDGWDGQFFIEQGAAGGFNYSTYNQLLVQCPECAEIYLPVILRNYAN